jgi:prefoldin subunit 5
MARALAVALAAVAVVLGALLALYHGENVKLKNENAAYKAQVDALTGEVASYKRQVSELNQKVESLERDRDFLTKRVADLEQQREALNRRVSDLEKLRDMLQQEIRSKDQVIQQLERQRTQLTNEVNSLRSELTSLRRELQHIRSTISEGKSLVERYREVLENIRITAPRVEDSWTFTYVYTTSVTLFPNYYTWQDWHLDVFTTLEVVATTNVYIRILSADGQSVAEGWRRVTYRPRANGTYTVVFWNRDSRTVTFDYTVTVSKTVYWYNNRDTLVQQIKRQYPDIPTQDAYALSLAALLKSAGFGARGGGPHFLYTTQTDVVLAAIGRGIPRDLFKPIGVIPGIYINAGTLHDLVRQYFNTLAITPMSIRWISDTTGLILLVDTYNVYTTDIGIENTVPFNVIYVEGYTELP